MPRTNRAEEIQEIRFQGQDERIETKEFIEIIKFFDRHLMVGSELERVVPSDQRSLANIFGCKSYGYHESHGVEKTIKSYKDARNNKFNVAFTTSDASFEYGNEVIFGGNNESFQWNHDKLTKIEKKLTELRAVPFSTKTSNHISCITAYNIGLKPIVLKNIFNITRAFSGALFWMGSGDKSRILRGSDKNIFQFNPFHFTKPEKLK